VNAGARYQAVVDANASILTLWPEGDTGRMVTQTQNSLLRAWIRTIGVLTGWTADQLMDRYNFGPAQLAEVRRVLDAAGLALKDDGAP